MAFMAMRKNLDERHRKKNFDEIFKKFDHNHNQRVSIREFTEVVSCFWLIDFDDGKLIYFLQEISEELEVVFDDKELDLLLRLADGDGLVIIGEIIVDQRWSKGSKMIKVMIILVDQR